MGARARSEIVRVALTPAELEAVKARVKAENAGMLEDVGDDGTPATVSSWFRDCGLDQLGLATFDGE